MRINSDEAIEIRKKIPIYHLHGSLGSLDSKSGQYRPYMPYVNEKSLKIAAESIKIIYEQSDEYDCKEVLRRSLTEADTIYFFGFGYHHINMRRLMNSGLREKLEKKDSCKIIALRHLIADVFWKKILKNQFEGLLEEPTIPPYAIDGYLNEYGFGVN